MAKSNGTRETQARISISNLGKMMHRSKPEKQARRNFFVFIDFMIFEGETDRVS